MKLKKLCENCEKEFEYSPSRRPKARFCSWSCLSKLTKKEQDEKRKIAWENESFEEYCMNLREKLKKYTEHQNECWIFTGCKNNQGYGTILFRHKLIKAHRASYIAYKGRFSSDLFVLHKCDNPPCINPEHLFLGDHAANMRDMAQKNRTKTHNKLTEDNVKDIKKLLRIGVNMTVLAKKFNVSNTAIWEIKHHKSWKHISIE